MASGSLPCVTQVKVCQLCGTGMQSCGSHGSSPNYAKKIDPPRPPFSQVIPDSRYDEEEMRKKLRKGKTCDKNKQPAQVCVAMPVVPNENSNCCNKTEKNSSSKPETEASPKDEKEKNKEKPTDSPLMKASCLPAGGQGQPVKMMLCLPCPPPASIDRPRGKQGDGACKPRDYTYRCESRELRMGNLYSCCHCLKRNGLQDDCPRTPCQGRPACLMKPWPDCWPSGGCHGIDFSREKGTKRYDPCKNQRFDKKECKPSGDGAKSDCGGNMMLVVCPPCGKK